MKATSSELLSRLPGPPSQGWLNGVRFAPAFANGSMSVVLYAPVGRDPQTSHLQDELYFIHSGKSEITIDGQRCDCAPGDSFFVPAGADHRFENFSADFVTWVVLWGPLGGEDSRKSMD
jgi:mannose-6-phosphate isomerase-like protein (cupin superfamily)